MIYAYALLQTTTEALAMAAVIASQAVISGAFSLTQQAIQLGYSPRLDIRHTSAHQQGQVYVPAVNWVLMLATVGLVVGFKSSSNLASAYGIAVTMTMVITALLLGLGIRDLSATPRKIPELKHVIRSLTIPEAERVAQDALQMETARDVASYLRGHLRRFLPELAE